MSLTFYYTPQSSATPVHWTLEELGVPHEKVRIDLQAGQQKQPPFLKINPNGKVPVLVHDGVPIFESAAIQIYLGETFGVERGLFPGPGPRRGEAMKWLVWCNVTLGDALSRYVRNVSERFPAEQRNAKAAEAAKAEVHDHLRVLDQALAGRQYLLGDSFMIPDLHLASWLAYLGMVGIDLSGYPAIGPWLARCNDRPACVRGD
jgi:glutathione S-transferase